MSTKLQSFKDLKVWQKGMLVTKLVYKAVRKFPEQERFGLVSQMTRAAVSIPSNIAEGWLRNSQKSFVQFLRVTLGSLGELETQTEVAREECYLSEVEYKELIQHIVELRRMLFSFIRSVSKTDNP